MHSKHLLKNQQNNQAQSIRLVIDCMTIKKWQISHPEISPLFLLPAHSFFETKNVPQHILAPAMVAYDIFIVRHSAHPAGGFLLHKKCNFPCNKKDCIISPKIIQSFSIHNQTSQMLEALFGEGMWESNPPRTLLTPHTGFEDQETHQLSIYPHTSIDYFNQAYLLYQIIIDFSSVFVHNISRRTELHPRL